jgi:superfamily II DNA or RNA helicase
MKAIISNKIYMVVEPSLYRALEKELTYHIPSYNEPEKFVTIKNLKVINFNIAGGKMLVAFPVGRIDLIPSNYEVVDKRAYNPIEDFPKFQFDLRPSQQEIHDLVDDNCIINAKVGYGKTFTALSLAAKLKQKTLVVVHTVALRNQWEKEVVKTLGIKPGVIGSGKYNIDSPVVVANIQSLAKHITKLSREFGLVVLDEMHHVSSPTFSKVIDALFSRYKIGLSGTIERKDQKHVVFKDYFGSRIFKPDKENTMTPEVHIINAGIQFPDGSGSPWAERINVLKQSYLYKDLVVALADSYSDKGHRVVIVSERVEFLKECSAASRHPSELLIGSVKDDARDKVIQRVYDGEVSQLWGTQSLVSEGLSINPLSCIILATPLNNMPLLEQLIGRVIREHPDKPQPVIVDIRLEGNTVSRQYNNRLGHYMKEGYGIKFIK